MKRLLETVFLAIGLLLLVLSLTFLTKPGASQGVKAMPQKYSLSLSSVKGAAGLSSAAVSAGTLDTLNVNKASDSASREADGRTTAPKEVSPKENGKTDDTDRISRQITQKVQTEKNTKLPPSGQGNQSL